MENKIYVSTHTHINYFEETSSFTIVVAASSKEVAREHVKKIIGFDAEPTWLMNAKYPTIYVSDGSVPHPIQAKILSNNTFHSK